jgi:hypothetical protein
MLIVKAQSCSPSCGETSHDKCSGELSHGSSVAYEKKRGLNLEYGGFFKTLEYETFSFLGPVITFILVLVEVDCRDGAYSQLESTIDCLIATSLNNCGLMKEAV